MCIVVHTILAYLILYSGPYKDRVSYNGSARIIFTKILESDEGWISCSVDYEKGESIYHKIYLTVASKMLFVIFNAFHVYDQVTPVNLASILNGFFQVQNRFVFQKYLVLSR